MENSLFYFMNQIKNWNNNVYGNIGHHKKRLIQELNRIQKVLDYSHSNYLHDLELTMRTELEMFFIMRNYFGNKR